jgi:N-acetylmuramoyl-L-alanine amidase
MKILLDNGHGVETPGKRSPDGAFREYKFARDMATEIVRKLKSRGVEAERIVPEETDVPLSERVRRVNAYCDKLGADNVLLVSIHCNAAGDGTKWMNARGWSAYTSRGQTRADRLATALCQAAHRHLEGLKIREDYSDGDADIEAGFYILTRTRCAAVLTENFFMDNREDLEFLESPESIDAIAQLHVDGILDYING